MLWMVIILMLLLGIYQRNLVYVRYWLVFTCLGIMLDALLLLYGLSLAVSIDWERVKITIMPFVGLGKTDWMMPFLSKFHSDQQPFLTNSCGNDICVHHLSFLCGHDRHVDTSQSQTERRMQ